MKFHGEPKRKKDTTMPQVLEKPQATSSRLSYLIKKPTYDEAKTIIRGRVFSMNQYKLFRLNNPQFNLPSNPDVAWKDSGWKGAYTFFGTTRDTSGRYFKEYWADVKAGKREYIRKPKTKKVVEDTASKQPVTQVKVALVEAEATVFEQKQAFISLAKKLGVYENFKPAFRTLFTIDELLELANL
jgi:hypothetical protein